MNWKQFWGVCEHKWKFYEKTAVYDFSFGDSRYPKYYEMTLQCEKCGDIKTRKT